MTRNQNAGRKQRVALVIPPPQKAGATWCFNLPIGIAYLAAVLQKGGHDVTVIDCPALELDHEKLRAKIAAFEPSVVGITSLTPIIKSTLLAAHITKEACPNAIVVLGGPHATFMDEQIVSENSEVDVVARGEGENTLLELADLMPEFNLEKLDAVAGITFRKNGQPIRTPDRQFIQNLDELPRPAYEHFALNKYRLFGKMVLPIMTRRGCSNRCSYCVSSRMNGTKCRTRSPKNVIDELEWLRDTHGADAFSFYDDAFTIDKERAIEICEGIKKRHIELPWDCQTRVDQISKEVLVKMREAKCRLISFGVESGNQKILNAMKKGTTVEQNEKAIKLAKEVGLTVSMSIILGYPGETTESIKQTMNFIRKTEPDYVYLCLATPYPGTELRDLVKELGWKMSMDWGNYDMQTPIFENPLLPNEKLMEARKKFYNEFFSPVYVLRQSLKGSFYTQIMARTALNYILWRTKLPKLVSAILRK
jgi:anaerobic magnesium-protoporphyrin IX monomethyl ester cyclase